MKKSVLLFTLGLLVVTLFSFTESNSKGTPSQPKIKNTIPPKKEVPVLCYHRIRNILPSDGADMKTYSVSPTAFAAQMKALHDNGFQSILPDQLYNYIVHNKPLPPKPVLITFDDTREEQYRIGAETLKKYGFKGVFFIMTVSINKPGYMNKIQIKALSDDGHVIGNHTWDHHRVTKYTPEDWNTQLLKPQTQLEKITGKPVHYFSYPFGLWNVAAVNELKKHNYKLAFQLSDRKPSPNAQFTVRRMIVPSGWSASKMMENMKATFK